MRQIALQAGNVKVIRFDDDRRQSDFLIAPSDPKTACFLKAGSNAKAS